MSNPFTTFSAVPQSYERSFYRSVALLCTGDAENHILVKRQVQNAFLVAYITKKHLDYDRYVKFEKQSVGPESCPLFALLECPELQPDRRVYRIVAKALRIQLFVWTRLQNGRPQGLAFRFGPTDSPKVNILRSSNSKMQGFGTSWFSHYTSLVVDRSGAAAFEYMLQEKDKDTNGLAMKLVTWEWEKGTTSGFRCYNGHDQGSRERGQRSDSSSEICSVVDCAIRRPWQIREALDLIERASLRSPTHGLTAPLGTKVLKPVLGWDAEFEKRPQQPSDLSRDELTSRFVHGEFEELVSVIVIFVGEQASFKFYILEMLENPTTETVSELSHFWEWFKDAKKIMLAYNLQSDMHAIKGSIAHMFQDDNRPDFQYESWYLVDGKKFHTIRPQWRLPKGQYFGGRLPLSLQFSRHPFQCPFHSSKLDRGLTCFCEHCILDVSTIFDYMCRTAGIANAPPVHGWGEPPFGYRYEKFLQSVLAGDRMLDLLEHFKNAPERYGDTGKFYSTIVGDPNLQHSNIVIEYLLGDVLGLVRALLAILTTDNRCLTTIRLVRHAKRDPEYSMVLPRIATPTKVSLGSGIICYNDHAKHFQRPTETKEPFSGCCPHRTLDYESYGDGCYNTAAPGDSSRTKGVYPFVDAGTLSYVDHVLRNEARDEVLSSMAEDLSAIKGRTVSSIFRSPTWDEQTFVNAARNKVRHELFDVCRFTLPEIMMVQSTHIPPVATSDRGDSVEDYPDPIIRAGSTYEEYLLGLLRSTKAASVAPPRGFGAPVGSLHGLPRFLYDLPSVPGADLPFARNIYDAFPIRGPLVGDALGAPTPEKPRKPLTPLQTLTEEETVAFMPGPVPDRNEKTAQEYFDALALWVRLAEGSLGDIEGDIKKEIQRNTKEGLPGDFDARDIWDPDGREYEARVKAAPDWNKPPLALRRRMFIAYGNGDWISESTRRLNALKRFITREKRKISKLERQGFVESSGWGE
ncbi:hypothetical protein BU16DRAFT_541053 [Lophium mytilinum]|uniref:Uncharacterized protein n=1 Tax=Lophium mytilinum TaxID=390894 RepID=A0A6A6QNN2_9PEZI|nr:hypothetical protein BU16DRAFT_541053 [Lophium mytilinum]